MWTHILNVSLESILPLIFLFKSPQTETKQKKELFLLQTWNRIAYDSISKCQN